MMLGHGLARFGGSRSNQASEDERYHGVGKEFGKITGFGQKGGRIRSVKRDSIEKTTGKEAKLPRKTSVDKAPRLGRRFGGENGG